MIVLKNKGAFMSERVGIIKEIDSLGRIVIPKDYRDRLQLGSRVEIILTTDGILIQNPEYELIKNSRRKEK